MNKKKTILVIDDEVINIDILLDLLDDRYDVIPALSASQALEILEKSSINLILLDIVMPNIDGYELCKRLKDAKNTKYIPVVFITANTTESSIEQAFEVGGVDYVTKPFKPKELLARVDTHLKMQELINDLRKSQEELKLLASIDPMTKLYNRRYFAEISKHVVSLSKREKTITTIIMIDIDKFKNINDTYGHEVGDKVIIYLSKKLKELTRESDVVCRYGGEEFVILLPETSTEGATIIANKIREEIQSLYLIVEKNQKIKYTISLGISQVKIYDKNIESALRRSDDALYKAKNNGRNQVCIL